MAPGISCRWAMAARRPARSSSTCAMPFRAGPSRPCSVRCSTRWLTPSSTPSSSVRSRSMANVEAVSVLVAWSPPPAEVLTRALTLPAGSTLEDALRAAGWWPRPADEAAEVQVGVWAKARPLDAVLREHDRVEMWRPLKVDNKEARSQRYQRGSKDEAEQGQQ